MTRALIFLCILLAAPVASALPYWPSSPDGLVYRYSLDNGAELMGQTRTFGTSEFFSLAFTADEY